MKQLRKASRLKKAALIAAVMAIGVIALVQSQPSAAGPTPDCGPTYEWSCALPNCPECPEILFEGTVCEKNAFEKATGRVCSL